MTDSVIKRETVALLWESWMLTRWGFLSRLFIALAFVLLVFSFYETSKEPDLFILQSLCFDIGF